MNEKIKFSKVILIYMGHYIRRYSRFIIFYHLKSRVITVPAVHSSTSAQTVPFPEYPVSQAQVGSAPIWLVQVAMLGAHPPLFVAHSSRSEFCIKSSCLIDTSEDSKLVYRRICAEVSTRISPRPSDEYDSAPSRKLTGHFG